MDVQVKAGSLVRTILHHEISGMVGKIVSQLHSEMTSVVSDFLSAGISAAGMLKLENPVALPGGITGDTALSVVRHYHYRGHSTFVRDSGIGDTAVLRHYRGHCTFEREKEFP